MVKWVWKCPYFPVILDYFKNLENEIKNKKSFIFDRLNVFDCEKIE